MNVLPAASVLTENDSLQTGYCITTFKRMPQYFWENLNHKNVDILFFVFLICCQEDIFCGFQMCIC